MFIIDLVVEVLVGLFIDVVIWLFVVYGGVDVLDFDYDKLLLIRFVVFDDVLI